MRQVVSSPKFGKVTLTDKQYLASGGEANIYVSGKYAYKVYHKDTSSIPEDKIKELQVIQAKNVLVPLDILWDSKNKQVGYMMAYKSKTSPLCKLFTKAFKTKNNVSPKDIVDLITEMQKTVMEIHKADCLVVDMNEMNILTSSTFKTPYFIDVDSFQTPSHKATAIMDSIRDRLVLNNQFTQLSDWYSFAILAFQLYIGIHPYKGKHPNYQPNEWGKRMDDGVSVFHPDVTLPKVCNDFSVIPASHYAWMQDLFVRNNRAMPPFADAKAPTLVPQQFRIIAASNDFDVTNVYSCPENIILSRPVLGVTCVVGNDRCYFGNKPMNNDTKGYRVELCPSSTADLIVAKLKDGDLYFEDSQCNKLGHMKAEDMMYRNGCIYHVQDGNLIENTFTAFGNKKVHSTSCVATVSEMSTKMFDGVVFQDLLGKCYMTLPFDRGKCTTIPIPELDKYRILEAKSEGNICGLLAEKKGTYYRFVFEFNKNYSLYNMRRTKDVPYAPINLTVMQNGVCVMAIENAVEIFKGSNVKTVPNPPFDSNDKLFNVSGSIHYIDGKEIRKVTMK